MGGLPKRIFTPEEVELIQKYAEKGIPQEWIAGFLGCASSTFEKRLKDSPDVHEAYYIGRAKAHGTVIETLYEMATDGKNTAATIFWLKAQCGFKEDGPTEPTKKLDLKQLRLAVNK